MIRFILLCEEKPRYLIITSRQYSRGFLVVDNIDQESDNRLNFLLLSQKKKNYYKKLIDVC